DITIDALYAFTDCEVSISPNACVIIQDKPHFLSVNEILRISTHKTVDLLKKELEIKKLDLMEKFLFSSLEKIFIEKRIYRNIEEAETWEEVLSTIDKGLKPYKKLFYREIVDEDLIRLTEIRIKRISKFDSFKADELMRRLKEDLKETEHNLANLVDFSIKFFQDLLKKYGAGRERKTEIRTFDTIQAHTVAAANQKLYVNRAEGFIGYGLKKDEFICECSDLDDVVAFRKDGICVMKKIGEKVFVGKDILFAGIFKKGDDRMVYNMIYLDGGSGNSMIKRFQLGGLIRDKEYDLTKGNKGSKVHYFTANPNGEAETVTVTLTPNAKARTKVFDFDFATVDIKGRASQGNILTRYPVKKVQFNTAGVSTLGGINIWYDEVVGRLNTDGRGKFLGNFGGEDRVASVYKNGSYEITTFELTNRFDPQQLLDITKLKPETVISAIHLDGDSKTYFVKRFKLETTTVGKPFFFISESQGSKLAVASFAAKPEVEIEQGRGKKETLSLDEFIDIKGWKALGNKLTYPKITGFKMLSISEEESPEEESAEAETKDAHKKEFALKKKESDTKKTAPAKGAKGSKDKFDVGTTIQLDFKPKTKK
ncbi:MAG: DNA gyrase subunit A, partial [Cytophagaceae bacterium]